MRLGYEVFTRDLAKVRDFYVLAAGVDLADGVQRRPWGLRDFRVFDPTGLYLRITETQPYKEN